MTWVGRGRQTEALAVLEALVADSTPELSLSHGMLNPNESAHRAGDDTLERNMQHHFLVGRHSSEGLPEQHEAHTGHRSTSTLAHV